MNGLNDENRKQLNFDRFSRTGHVFKHTASSLILSEIGEMSHFINNYPERKKLFLKIHEGYLQTTAVCWVMLNFEISIQGGHF